MQLSYDGNVPEGSGGVGMSVATGNKGAVE